MPRQSWVSITDADLKCLENSLGSDHELILRIRKALFEVDDTEEAYRQAANDLYADDECQVDDNAVVSSSAAGAFVMGWLWVDAAEAGVELEAEEVDE
jgi:hypothetical protein